MRVKYFESMYKNKSNVGLFCCKSIYHIHNEIWKLPQNFFPSFLFDNLKLVCHNPLHGNLPEFVGVVQVSLGDHLQDVVVVNSGDHFIFTKFCQSFEFIPVGNFQKFNGVSFGFFLINAASVDELDELLTMAGSKSVMVMDSSR